MTERQDIVARLRQDFTTDPIPLHAEAAAEIDRLRTALKPFAEVGRPFVRACETGAIPGEAEARYLKLAPLVAADFARAATAFDHEQGATRCPDHPTGRLVDDDGRRICETCGRTS